MTAAVLCTEADDPRWPVDGHRPGTGRADHRSRVRPLGIPRRCGVTVHLRLPTAFCSPNFAYLMASDALDALRRNRGHR